MKIVACIKQVPAISEVSIDPETKRLKREGIEAVMNPFDLYAVEEAVLLREQLGGEVYAVSMGPKQAEWSIREALAIGADRGILLSDRAFGGSDTWATSYALASAVRHIGDVDLVICGKQAVDGDTAQVGPGLAAHLGWPQATYISQLIDAKEGQLKLTRMQEGGWSVVELDLPAVITVVKDINHPRVPTLRNVRNSRREEVPVLTPDIIGAEVEKLGLNGSPTRVVKTFPPPPREAETMVLEGSPEESAQVIVHELRMMSLV
jgi:electron transfer flavoprotein beta subunit